MRKRGLEYVRGLEREAVSNQAKRLPGDVSGVRQLESPLLQAVGSGERALFVAEELAFEQLLR